MASITRNHLYTVDLNKPLTRQSCGILLAEGDNNGDCFSFALVRDGVAVIPGGALSVTAYFIRDDGNTVFLTGESSNINRASVTLPQSCYIGEGRFSLAVKVAMDGVTTTIAVLDGYIKNTQSDTLIDPGSVIPSLDELFAQIAAMEAATAAANTAANNAKEFIVTVTAPIIVGEDATADKTFAEIKAAINAGKTPAVQLKMQGKIEVDTLHLYKSGAMSIVFRQQVKHTADYNIVSALQCIFTTAGVSVDSVNFRSVPDGGTDGQVLVHKGESTYEWRDPSGIAGIAPAIIPTATGSIVTITDGAARPAVELISHIEPVQSGSGDASPDNVRAISGWNAAEVNAAGANLLSGSHLAEILRDKASAAVDTSAGTVTYSAAAIAGVEILPSKTFKPATQYTIILYGKNINAGAYHTNITVHYAQGYTQNINFDLNNPDNDSYGVLTTAAGHTVTSITGIWSTGTTTLYYDKCGVFEGAVTVDAFVESQGKRLTADLPETVYGGTLDWTTGVLTVTHGIKKLSDLTWAEFTAWGSNHTFYTSDIRQIGVPTGKNVCEAYAEKALSPVLTGAEDGFCVTGDDGNFFISDSRFTDAASFKAGVTGYIVYQLQTPYTIQLTPQQLDTLKGTNNVWSDCGDTTLSYVADTKMYIDQKLAAIAAATI